MKFTIESRAIKSIMGRMVAVCENRTTIPILQHVKIAVDDFGANFTATDLDIQIKEQAYITAQQPGTITAPAFTLNDIVKKFDDGALVQFEMKDDMLHITSGKSNFKLNTLHADDFPTIASDVFEAEIDFAGDVLKSAIDRTIWAVSTEETRYYLNGIALQPYEGFVTTIATDGHRLAKYATPVSSSFPSVIVPAKTAKQFSSVMVDTAKLFVSATKVKLVTGGVEIISKVIDGNYPDWTRVIPKDSNQSVTVASVDLAKAVERVQVVMDDRTKIIGITIAEGELTVFAKSGAMGTANDVIDAVKNGNDAEIGLNGKYALDAMRQAEKGSVTIHYNTPGDPMRLAYEKEPELLVIIMPARL